ncbi:hypothetical protein SARC_07615 [Sphaeroforma arctica JP610]|uniref:P-type ATPase C-terminal domain-containing protein n=1 Tax=Sphaeroforma arctica JP610 TaxID=667725 RepID=A0A0L0FTW0_9EUKA|nr:hypothetical protein SARC_07615 [Sphaeroforma arctica JP610]KNC80021.1 hypothetical protein SARC_07615 [Sphaeroforma arctica JP610]|eukprot:XP_014153923.1 hypothetical protein SARC_07615 [Sphaeroforma arctica JP610]
MFVYWMVRAVAQGLFCFYCCTLALGYTAIDTQQGGLILGQDGLAMVCYANAIMIQAMNLGLQTHSFTWMNHVVIWGLTPMVWVVFGAATLFPMFGDYPLFFEVQDTWIFWILMPLVLVGSLVPFVGFEQLFMPQAVALSKKMNSVLHVS